MLLRRSHVVVLVLIALTALVAVVTGCAQQQVTSSLSSMPPAPTTAGSSTTTATTTTAAGTAPTEAVSSTASAETPTTTVGVSPDAIAYAKSLGGTSHEGETLYFVVGATAETEQAAQAVLDEATPQFGDMQSYFIVQMSDNFEGLEPGGWVVLEAYRNEPSPENLEFDRRGFPDAQVESATVRTADPIPVYEDLVGGD